MKQYYQAIDEIINFLKLDLIGPINKDEILKTEEPLNLYVMGILWPKRPSEAKNNFHFYDDEYDEDDDAFDEDLVLHETIEDRTQSLDDTINTINNINKYKPSTMAISTILPAHVTLLDINFSYAKYSHSSVEIANSDFLENYYTRNANELNFKAEIPNKITDVVCDDYEDEFNINIVVHIRKIMPNGDKLITVSVSNTTIASQQKTEQNSNALFQCKLDLTCNAGFLPIYNNSSNDDNTDNTINDMLYKNIENYSYGHGCATVVSDDKTCISSDFLPTQIVFQMMPNSIKVDEFLKLSYWKNIDVDTACTNLLAFIKEYEIWLELQIKQSKVSDLSGYKDAIKETFSNIDTCIKRLKDSVFCLLSNPETFQAFRLMNEAMLLQRIKTKNCSEDSVKWYPFQLAYILQIIPDLVHNSDDDISKYHDMVDLLWFPTGGGKTEAYLGVAAFTIFYERLTCKTNASDGVLVFMRYTLRLLTIQQFQRSAALICACDYLKKQYNIPGEEISIGLFIGKSMTPNKIIDASNTLDKMRYDSKFNVSESNPIQLEKCPWCGELLDISCYNIVDESLKISCRNNKTCDFHSKLPIYLVDDDIYVKKPTLVLSTIDKFARITWEERANSLFANPIKLVIQDELHLISGPIGSLAGIYEIAIDELSSTKPKIIASTATVKMADTQIKNLYNREMLQFPPNGLTSEDSFFAIASNLEERPARTYIGVCEQGGSITDLMIRIYANLLFLKELFIKQNKPTKIIDHFYTTIGYFNAIRDLGATSSVIADRVTTNIRALITHKFKDISTQYGLEIKDISWYRKNDELTSRKSSKQIKNTLDRLELPYTEPNSYSYVLASNMLSVGIDINRLGVMTVYNQPKSNSEYIQATSRVGRQNPGLVVMMYNGSRSRDKSHYEQFSFYHKSFYQYVEATSVTPFSDRAIEKALHCVFIALVRHKIPNMNDNNSAGNFRADLDGITEIKANILNRIKNIYPTAIDLAKEWLEYTCHKWEKYAVLHGDRLVYKNFNGEYISLLISNANDNLDNLDFPLTLNSLRNVEDSSNIYIKKRGVKLNG